MHLRIEALNESIMWAKMESNLLELSVVLGKDGPPLEENPDLEPIVSPNKRHQLFD